MSKHVLTGAQGQQVTMELRKTWCLRAYLACLIAFCRLTGARPDYAKLHRRIERGMEMRLITTDKTTGFVAVDLFRKASGWMQG